MRGVDAVPTNPKGLSDRGLAYLLVLLTLVVYLPTMRAGFVWDDDVYLTENPLIQASDGLYRFWFTTEPTEYYPFTSTTWWFEWRLWGTDPRGYHATNVLLHALNSLLIWQLLRQLGIPGAWLAAAIFAVHPVNVASVAWISERKNTLSLLLYLLTILLYWRFEDRSSGRWYWLSLLAFLLALFSKTAVVMLPFVLLGCTWWRRGQIDRKDLLRGVPFFALSLVLGLVTVWFQYQRMLGGKPVRVESFFTRLAEAGWSVWFYLYKALLPFNLGMIYPRWEVKPWGLLAFLPGVLLLAAFVLCWRYRASWGRILLFALGYFVVTLFPVLGFFDQGFYVYSLVADHWQYPSIIGIIALVAAGGAALSLRLGQRPVMLLAGALVAGLSVLSWRQCGIYKDQETLWRDTIAKNPNAWVGYYGLGVAAGLQGHLNEAVVRYRETLRLNPFYDRAHNNLGVALAKQGNTNEAIAHFLQALQIRPDSPRAHYNLGDILAHQGKLEEALAHLSEAVRGDKNFASAHYRLAKTWERKGKLDLAVGHYNEVLRIRPDWPEALGDFAWTLATHPEIRNRGAARAVELAAKACALTDYADAKLVDTLAVAYAAAGKFPDAVRTARQARDIAVASGQLQLAAEIESRLKLYEADRPFEAPK